MGRTHVSDVDARDAASPVAPHTLDHLVENLARIRLGTQGHLDPVQPPLGILARRALERYVGASPVAKVLELANHRILGRHSVGQRLEVHELQLV